MATKKATKKAPAKKAGRSAKAAKKKPPLGKAKTGMTLADWEAAGGDADEYKAAAAEALEATPKKTKAAPSAKVKAKAEAAKRRTKKRGTQLELEGMERPKIAEVEQAAESYEQVRDARCVLSAEEREKKETLIEVMTRHGLKYYKFEDHEVFVTESNNVRVKRLKPEDEDPDLMDT